MGNLLLHRNQFSRSNTWWKPGCFATKHQICSPPKGKAVLGLLNMQATIERHIMHILASACYHYYTHVRCDCFDNCTVVPAFVYTLF